MTSSAISPSSSADQVSQLAYELFVEDGSRPGRELQHWTDAESILKVGKEHEVLLSLCLQNGELWIRIKPPELLKLDEGTLARIDEAITRIVDLLPRPRIVIDLTAVHYLCSTMIGMMAFLNHRARGKGGHMSVVHTTRSLHEEMHLWGLDRLMEVKD